MIHKFYAYVGKDIGMFAYNYYQKGEYSSTVPRMIAYYNIGDVRDIVPTDEFIYVASQKQGFFIIEAPPQIHTYLPVVKIKRKQSSILSWSEGGEIWRGASLQGQEVKDFSLGYGW